MNLTITLAVSDLERTAEFYHEVLGLRIERLDPVPGRPLVLLSGNETDIVFRETASLEASHPALFQNLDRHPRGVGVTLEFTLEGLDSVEREVSRRGLHLLYELEDDEHDRRELWLHDPDGYLLILNREAQT